MVMKKFLKVSAVALVTGLLLSGCTFGFTVGDDANTSPSFSPSASPSSNSNGGSSSGVSSEVTVLDESETRPFPEIRKSEPLGTWTLENEIPAGFPAGVPAITDRFIDDAQRESTTGEGLPLYGFDFWGGYAEVEKVVAYAEANGWKLWEKQDTGTRRAYILQNDAHRLTITVSENVPDIDPMYSYALVKR